MPSTTTWAGRVKATCAGVGLAMALTMAVSWLNIYVNHVPKCHETHCVADFIIFYAQPMMIWENPQSLYDLDQQLIYQQKVAPTERVLVFPYPPILAFVLAPLALLSFSQAFLAMTLLNIALLATVLRTLVAKLELSGDQSHWLGLFALCSFGVQGVLSNGQSSVIVLFFLTGHMLAHREGKDIAAGVWAGWLCVKPQYLIVPHFALLLQRSWRSFWTGVLVVTVLIGGSFALLGARTLLQYLDILFLYSSYNAWTNPLTAMHNLKALTGTWLPAPWGLMAWGLLAVVVLAGLIWINLQTKKLSQGFELRWIANSIALLLLTPHLFAHDLSFLTLPCALLLRLVGNAVPLWLGVSLVSLGMLPAVNYKLPTIMAAALLLLFLLTLNYVRHEIAKTR